MFVVVVVVVFEISQSGKKKNAHHEVVAKIGTKEFK